MKFDLPRLKRLAWWGLGGLILFAVIGFLILPPILKAVMTKQLTEQLHRTVTIEGIQINPFLLSIRIAGLAIKDRSGDAIFLGFEELFVDAQIVSLVKGGPVLREIRLKDPQVNIIRNEDETYNFSDLLEIFGSQPATASPDAKDSKPLRFSVNNIQLEGGSVEFEDKPKATHHTVQDIRVAIPFLSNLPYETEIFVQPAFEAVVNDTSLRLSGKTKPFHDTLETTLEINVSDIDIPKYLAYLPAELPVRIPTATMGIQAEVSFVREGNRPSLKVDGRVEVKKLTVTDLTKHPLLTLPLLTIVIDSDEILARKVHLASVVVQSPELHVQRDRAGALNLAALAPKASASQPARVEPKEQKPKTDAPAMSVEVDQAKLTDARIRFVDETTTQVFRTMLDNINLEVNHFSTAKNSRADAKLNLTLDKKGSIGLTGAIGVDPLFAQLKAEIKNVDLVPFQPYLNDSVNVILTSGSLMTKGDVEFTMTPGQKPALTFTGESSITKFRLLDQENSEELLKWASLALNGVRVHTEPQKIHIQQVSLTDFYSRLIVNADGKLNVQGLAKHKVESKSTKEGDPGLPATTPGKKPVEPTPVAIDAVTLQGGVVDFTDRLVKPHVTANMTNMGGKVTGLSSEESQRAQLEFRGQLRNHSPLLISGTINPLSRDLYADIKMDFKNIELSPLSPYAIKYAGYTIQKGILSLSLSYHIENQKLAAGHHLYIDQFTFGEKVESPDATNLPVRLAVSLLQDRKGVIDLDFPVSGSLDDPQFSVWGVLVQVLKNLLVKAATSPFALLQSIVGKNIELSHLEFDFGKASLGGAADEKLNALAKVLTERPSLHMEITGHVDMEKDREGLRKDKFDRKVKAQKLADQAKRGETDLSLETIQVKPDEYEEYLTRAYKQETFPKPRNVIGLNKSLPVPEMEKLMLTYLEITDDDLHELAGRRAQAVMDFLVEQGKVNPQRLFLVEAKSLPPERKENLRDSRVDFTLR